MKRAFLRKALWTFPSITLLAATAALTPPPPAAVQPVTDDYFGTKIVDPYRWMETPNNPELALWMKQQNGFTRSTLERLPGRIAFRDEMRRSFRDKSVDGLQIAGGTRFFVSDEDGGVDKLYAESSASTRLVFDPQAGVEAGSHGAIEYFAPSASGKYVVVGVALNGAERETTIRIIETATGRALGDRISRSWGSTPIWSGDAGFFFTRLPKPSSAKPNEAEERAQAFFHRLGSDADAEHAIFGYGFDRRIVPIDGSFVFTAKGSSYAIGVVQHGTESDAQLFAAPLAGVMSGHPTWRFLGDAFVDPNSGSVDLPGLVDIALKGSMLYAIRFDSRRQTEVTKTNLASGGTLDTATIVVASGKRVDRGLSGAADGVYVWSMSAGLAQLSKIDVATDTVRKIALPVAGTMTEPAGDYARSGVVVGLTSWTKPYRYFAYDPAAGSISATDIASKPADFGSQTYQTDEVMVTSKDGTPVPLSIVHQAGLALDGSHATILIGYGAYGTSLEANYIGGDPWIERGGVLAFSHVRGGGEFGEPWHLAGKGSQKQHTIDDFIACAEYLSERGYASHAKLAGWGVSAGGITIGNAIVQRPDLFAAAYDGVGITDLLRFENSANGPSNVPEFGSVKNADGFKNLYAVSAYDHVAPGTRYPATMLGTGINDPRVPSWMVAKMAARLQAATSSGKPILLRVNYKGGHGLDTSQEERADLRADVESFFLWQMGDPAFVPDAASKY